MQVISRSSIVIDVMKALREAITEERFAGHLPGIRRLSQELGVSLPTVLAATHALAKEGLLEIRPGRPTAILKTTQEKRRATARARPKLVMVGFAPENIEQGNYRDIANDIRQQGYEVEAIQFHKKLWGLNTHEFNRLMKSYQADLWLLVNVPQNIHQLFVKAGASLLVVGAAADGLKIPDFENDYIATYRHAAHQFLNHGHERILFLIGERSAEKNPKSIEAFVETIRERYPRHHYRTLIRKYGEEMDDFRAILEAEFLGKPREQQPTALLIALVSRLTYAQTWLLAHGYAIPRDVSIIGRDGDETMEYFYPAPTHYASRLEAVRRLLVRNLLSLLEGRPLKEQHTLLLPDFHQGATLGQCGSRTIRST